jgi:hypothetical protein
MGLLEDETFLNSYPGIICEDNLKKGGQKFRQGVSIEGLQFSLKI